MLCSEEEIPEAQFRRQSAEAADESGQNGVSEAADLEAEAADEIEAQVVQSQAVSDQAERCLRANDARCGK